MMKKMNQYFSKATAARFLRIAAIVLALAGAIMIFRGRRLGTFGVPLAVVGVVMYFLCDARIISDKSYDDYMRGLLDSDEQVSSGKNVGYSFDGYSGVNASEMKICQDTVRTDRLVRTEITTDKNSIYITANEVSINGEKNHQEMTFKLGTVHTTASDENNVHYIAICSNDSDEELYKFPVQKNDYNAEQFCDYVNSKHI